VSFLSSQGLPPVTPEKTPKPVIDLGQGRRAVLGRPIQTFRLQFVA
jgi:hypothetical protein